MCRRVECSTCQKPTYAGCGMHIEQVLGDVPTSDRCQCRQGKGQSVGDQAAQWLKNVFSPTKSGR